MTYIDVVKALGMQKQAARAKAVASTVSSLDDMARAMGIGAKGRAVKIKDVTGFADPAYRAMFEGAPAAEAVGGVFDKAYMGMVSGSMDPRFTAWGKTKTFLARLLGNARSTKNTAIRKGKDLGINAIDVAKAHPKTTAAIGGSILLGGGGATAYALTRDGKVVPNAPVVTAPVAAAPVAAAPVAVAPAAPAPAGALQKLLDFTKANKGALIGGAAGTTVGGTAGYLGAKAFGADKSTQLLATLLSAATLGTGGAIAGHYGYDKNQA